MNSIYVLGAGFSKAAGFPLGCELFNDILTKVKRRRRTPLQADGASKAPPHESGIMLTDLKTRHVYIV